MYRPYAVRHPWESRREVLAVAKCYGGSSSSTPEIPPEFRPFITSALSRMTQQQGLNPIDSYNAPNPMEVEGMSNGQRLGMGYATGNLAMNNPLNAMAMQAMQRAAGMGGQGPTTGTYDSSGEMGLQDWSELMNPYLAQGGEMGEQVAPRDALADAAGSNVPPSGGQGTDYTGGPPNMSGPPPGGGAQGHGGSGSPFSQPGGTDFQSAMADCW